MQTSLARALVAISVVGTLSLTTYPAATAAGTDDVLDANQRVRAALPKLGDKLPAVAKANGMTVAELRREAKDPTAWLDTDGRMYFVEPKAKRPDNSKAEPAPLPYSETFSLHSRPGSQRTVYLDFTGHTLQGTAWQRGRKPVTINPYDSDGNFGSFSAAEQDVIQSVWQRVAEDYATVDVDVTTEEPAQDLITRDGVADQVYGTRLLVSPDTFYYSSCGCGGVAYVGVFDEPNRHDYYQPAWVFTRGVGTGAKNIAEAASHEVGHNLGLSHDGTSSIGYYRGHGAWAPIMGVGYYEAITQWSKGEYADANNLEDDFVVMASHGALTAADDHGNTIAAASALAGTSSGTIGTAGDVDVFSFTSSGGPTTVTVDPAPVSPNLDVRLEILSANGSVVAAADPSASEVNGDTAAGLGASTTADLPAGTYYVRVDGVGFGDPRSTGYSDYGSLGDFTISRS